MIVLMSSKIIYLKQRSRTMKTENINRAYDLIEDYRKLDSLRNRIIEEPRLRIGVDFVPEKHNGKIIDVLLDYIERTKREIVKELKKL